MTLHWFGYADEYLHSTMYLLKQSNTQPLCFHKASFTFHYVSIKTKAAKKTYKEVMHLHSTMYLLKPVRGSTIAASFLFTFHYVSIKTR